MKRPVILSLLCLSLLLPACGGGDGGGSKTTPVVISLRVADGAEAVAASAVDGTIHRIVVSISGPDFSTLTQEVIVEPGQQKVEVSFDVPPGLARQVEALAFDDQDLLLFRGTTTVDVGLTSVGLTPAEVVQTPEGSPIQRIEVILIPVLETAGSTCGDGIVDTGEACDDGNTTGGDGCAADCSKIEQCGDGTVDTGEACDDGNTTGGDGCAADCSKIEQCGDGTVDTGEACDDGNTTGGDGCAADCSRIERCGDGTVDTGEACDDGNTTGGDGCAADCSRVERCGDGTVDAGEACDDGNTTGGDGCAADCSRVERCGDGTVDAGEACDDGNTTGGDGCAADCSRVERCGDGTVDAGEACDDGNTTGGDGCAADCSKIERCGDGTVDAGEACDDGNTTGGDGCAADCSKIERCGDGTVDAGEACDDGNTTGGDGCAADCSKVEQCGDGTVDAAEACDDGNQVGGDGCAANCSKVEQCGDGVVDTGEACDDGNTTSGDGCAADCTREAQPAGRCGDGTVDPGEQCDDGGQNSGTAPDACRTDCTTATCGDGVVDSEEVCDDGNTVGGDGCAADCSASSTPPLSRTYVPDTLGASASAAAIVATSDGGYVVAGQATISGNTDAEVVKVDGDGAVVWAKSYGGDGFDEALAIHTVPLSEGGGYIVAGQTRSFGAGGADGWLLRLNADDGTVMWQKAYGGAGFDALLSVEPTADGGFVAAGKSSSFGQSLSDGWVLKVDVNGDVNVDVNGVEHWSARYGSFLRGDLNEAIAVRELAGGGYLVAGRVLEAASGEAAAANPDAWVMRLAADGTILWQQGYGGADAEIALSIEPTAGGGSIVAGETWSASGGSDPDGWLLKLNDDGSVGWNAVLRGSGADSTLAVWPASDGSFVAAGETDSAGGGGVDGWLVKVAAGGGILWQKAYGGVGDDRVAALRETADGGYIAAGETASFGSGGPDLWVIKVATDGALGCNDVDSTATAPSLDLTPVDTQAQRVDVTLTTVVTDTAPIATVAPVAQAEVQQCGPVRGEGG